MDLAASIQQVTEEVVFRLANTLHKEAGCENLCLAGGVALNCVSNGKLVREGPFKNIWVQPAAGDAGGALGAAYITWFDYLGNARTVNASDSMQGAYLGPQFSGDEIERQLNECGAVFTRVPNEDITQAVATKLSQEQVVGWFQGRMEFGPRALGGRSIIGDPRSPKMQSIMNFKIKYRESFRPFAPSVLSERVNEYFELDRESPYMLIVAPLAEHTRIDMTEDERALFGIEKLNVSRSTLPAITHVDYSARIQTVHQETNPRYHALISEFERQTECAVVVNTSFNVRGEPIVCTPSDAYRCFMRTEMDYLVVENFLLDKTKQPEWSGDDQWMDEFELD
jgi:carbamoyltransferase